MKLQLTLLAFCTGLLPLFAQQIDLSGQISIHNSRYRTGEIEYVPNASVQAPFAGETSSDSKGQFSLTFQGIKDGTSIRLSVEKVGLEVVNRKDLSEVVLGRLRPIQISLAPKGQVAQAQLELYNISKDALLWRHNRQIDLLRQANAQSDSLIHDMEQKLNTEIANRYEAEELLNQQLQDVQRRLPDMARKLASVNLDFVSDMYRTAYEYLRVGEVELAIETLDEAILDEEARQIIERIQISREGQESLEAARQLNIKTLDTLIRSQVLQARILAQEGDYITASNIYREALQSLRHSTEKEVNADLDDLYAAALLALINEKETIACALFERALAASPLAFSINEQIYDEAAADRYVQLIRNIKTPKK